MEFWGRLWSLAKDLHTRPCCRLQVEDLLSDVRSHFTRAHCRWNLKLRRQWKERRLTCFGNSISSLKRRFRHPSCRPPQMGLGDWIPLNGVIMLVKDSYSSYLERNVFIKPQKTMTRIILHSYSLEKRRFDKRLFCFQTIRKILR